MFRKAFGFETTRINTVLNILFVLLRAYPYILLALFPPYYVFCLDLSRYFLQTKKRNHFSSRSGYFDCVHAVQLEGTPLPWGQALSSQKSQKRRGGCGRWKSSPTKMFLVSTRCFYLFDNNSMCWISNFWSHIPVACSSVVTRLNRSSS